MPGPEELARQTIDAQLSAVPRALQCLNEMHLRAARGVAVCQEQSVDGPANCIFFMDSNALSVVEAKKAGTLQQLAHGFRDEETLIQVA